MSGGLVCIFDSKMKYASTASTSETKSSLDIFYDVTVGLKQYCIDLCVLSTQPSGMTREYAGQLTICSMLHWYDEDWEYSGHV